MTETEHDSPSTSTQAELKLERAGLARAGRLHAIHWAVICSSVLITFAAWHLSRTTIDERSQLRFDRHADRAVQMMQERLHHYESILWAGTAALQSLDKPITANQWREYSEYLNITERYPGTAGIGVIQKVERVDRDRFVAAQRKIRPSFDIYPEHDHDVLLPIVHVEPRLANLAAVGLDVAFEKNRLDAAMMSMRSGSAQISGPITLVQDEGQTPGFLFYAPLYQHNRRLDVQQRLNSFAGFVYAPLIVQNMVAGTIAQRDEHVAIRISDQGMTLYDEQREHATRTPGNARYSSVRTLDVYGRQWQFDIVSTPLFLQDSGQDLPAIILTGGLLIDTMLLIVFLTITRMNRKSLSFADRTTEQLQANAEHLKLANEQLSSFAYVVSHDLKTPLRGIHDLVSFLEDDLQSHFETGQADPEIARNISRLYKQVNRSNSLIDGILDYSGIEMREPSIGILDTAELIRGIGSALGVKPAQLISRGVMPVFETSAIELQQVLSNLVDNAFKYHHDREHGIAVITVTEDLNHYNFSVADNGPGIERQYFTLIFEPFKTLQSKDEIESTGIGLSIVKRSVEKVGGTVKVQSVVGTGTVFSFNWPKQAPGVIHIQRAA